MIDVKDAIKEGNTHLAWIFAAIWAAQFIITLVIGERAKAKIREQYGTKLLVVEGRIKARNDAELAKFKNSLSQGQMVFDARLKAYNGVRSFYYRIVPTRTHPEEDWGEALDEITANLSDSGVMIRDFLMANSGTLPSDVREMLENALRACEDGKFGEAQSAGESSSAVQLLLRIQTAVELFEVHLFKTT
jgi:hypothetical protein